MYESGGSTQCGEGAGCLQTSHLAAPNFPKPAKTLSWWGRRRTPGTSFLYRGPSTRPCKTSAGLAQDDRSGGASICSTFSRFVADSGAISAMSDFLQAVQERVVIYDGAMGTNIQFRNPSVDDYWGKEGCNELLVLSRPDIIKDIHAAFYTVGCDVVETDTFGATRVVLAEYVLQDKVHEINFAAAKLAREVAASFNG